MEDTTIDSIPRLRMDDLGDDDRLCDYTRRDRPFIVTGAMSGELAPPACSLDTFIERYGDHVVRVSDRTFYLPFSTAQCSVRQYVEHMMRYPRTGLEPSEAPIPYVFHDDLGKDAALQGAGATDTPFEITRMCPLPALFTNTFENYPSTATRIAVGPQFSHSGIHTHGVAVNMLAFGQKHWYLYPSRLREKGMQRLFALIRGARVPAPQLFWLHHFHPLCVGVHGDIRDRIRTAAEMLADRGLYEIPPAETWTEPLIAEDIRGVEAVQTPGDVMFVPERWAHWVINEAWSLAVIYELVMTFD